LIDWKIKAGTSKVNVKNTESRQRVKTLQSRNFNNRMFL